MEGPPHLSLPTGFHCLCLFPDTFASKAAAIQDVYADASIGNVTGSNAVNVFLGIGLAWSVAAIYWALHRHRIHPGALGPREFT